MSNYVHHGPNIIKEKHKKWLSWYVQNAYYD